MESLRHLLMKKKAFVASPDHDGNPPTDDQLASFLRTLTTETGLALRGTPQGVRKAKLDTHVVESGPSLCANHLNGVKKAGYVL